jgi:hypothetical protein
METSGKEECGFRIQQGLSAEKKNGYRFVPTSFHNVGDKIKGMTSGLR